MRKVNIFISNVTQGDAHISSYPDNQKSKKIKYKVPLYIVNVEGVNHNGTRVSEVFNAVRFGVHKPYGSDRIRVVGLSDDQTHTLTWDNISTMTENAWRVYDGFFIHPGPDYPMSQVFGSIGCVEICGVGEWDRFNETILNLTGAKDEYEVSDNKLLTAEYQSATRPPLTPVKK